MDRVEIVRCTALCEAGLGAITIQAAKMPGASQNQIMTLHMTTVCRWNLEAQKRRA
jgi:hypothetical protein